MPLVSRLFVKSGLLFMVAALIVGVAINAPESWDLPRWFQALESTHFHLFVVGWITQIIFGVALWFFPKWNRDQPRGPAWLSWGCLGTLNVGLVLRAFSETAFAVGAATTGWAWTMTIAALLQFIAAGLFAVAIWPRVKGR